MSLSGTRKNKEINIYKLYNLKFNIFTILISKIIIVHHASCCFKFSETSSLHAHLSFISYSMLKRHRTLGDNGSKYTNNYKLILIQLHYYNCKNNTLIIIYYIFETDNGSMVETTTT